MSDRKLYLRGPNGQMFEDNAEAGFPEAPPGLKFLPLAGGKFMSVEPGPAQPKGDAVDLGNALANQNIKPADMKQKLKRKEAIERQLETMVKDMVTPQGGADFLFVKDEKYEQLHAEYRLADAAGEGRRCDFQPLSTYAQKILRIRPLWKGEVGTLQMPSGGLKIVCLEPGFGEGQQFTGMDVEKSPEESTDAQETPEEG